MVKPDSLFGGTFNFPFLENLAIFGASTRSYIIKLYSRDLTGFVSTAYAVTVNNTVPAIQSFTIFSGVSSIYIKVTTTPEIDVTGYQVHRSLTSGFTPGAGTLIYDGADTYITLNVPDTQTYYYKIAAYDSFDKLNLIYSSQQSNTALSLDAITWSTTGLVFGVGTTNQLTWTAGTIVKSGSTTYTIAAGNATWTTGYLYAYFNPAVSTTVIQTTTTLGTAVGVGCYPIATYKGGAVTNIAGGTGSAFISGSQIIAGTVGASQIIAGSIVASNISTTTAVITAEAQIASAVINNAAIKDYIQSSNYSTTAHTGWRLDKTANMITTYGGLQVLDSTGATILSSGTTPTWNWTNVTGTLKPADNATKTFVYSQATVPPTPNEGDVWYVSATLSGYVSGAVYIYKGGAWIRTADATSSQLGGSGVNILDPRFATFEESALPPFSTHASGTLSQDATAKYFGTKSLKIVTTGISGYWNGNTGYTTNIQPNKKWIISGYVYSSTIIAAPVWGTAGIHLGVYTPSAYYGTAGYDGNAAYGTLTIPANTWTRIYGVLDLTADSNTTCLLRLDSHATGTTVWFDGIMLEAQVGNLVTPSVYQEPANFLTTFVGALDATKNTIFRQISAPTGGNYTVGDLWFDTDSNPPAFYNWSGTAWTMVSNAVTNTNQVTDGAALGQTSLWTGVSGTGRPSDNATVGATFGTNINGSITAANVATYISNLAVQTAQIANLAVTTGKIANLAVDTLQIAGNAVIVPVSVFSTSAVGVSLGSFASGWITIATATANLTGGGASSVLRIDSLTGYDPASGSNTANYNNTLFAGQSVRLINVGTGAVLQTLLKGSLMWDTNNNIEIGSISQGSLTIPCNSSITVALQMFVINNLNTPNSDSIVATRSLNLIGAKSSV
ncbi:hypothetical protein UFOVP1516_87 [uncultured Caudovirales phage]|uniref:Uncharacterized protein n=1 Tax=uncultured Caudovirales phage TaxID=2100421 RepID=A0A6J7XGL1_9CAUD|nr:hypothetical protein UFOVP1516_87 [uncultured Caudovirales phage]